MTESLKQKARPRLWRWFLGRQNFRARIFSLRAWLLALLQLGLLLSTHFARAENSTVAAGPLWKNPAAPLDRRVRDLVGRLTLEEKALQLCNHAPAIPRLGLPAYDYWNECLHGVARNGVATVFPQAIGMAATWDVSLLRETADVIATEARAKHRAYAEAHNGDSANYTGLTL